MRLLVSKASQRARAMALGLAAVCGFVLSVPALVTPAAGQEQAAASAADPARPDDRIAIVAKRDAAALPAPTRPLGGYAHVELAPMTLSALVKADPRKVAKAADLESRLSALTQQTLAAWNARASAAPDESRLIIKPHLQSLKVVSGGARFFAGALSGDSSIAMVLQLVDASSGAVIASPTIVKSANGFAGAWSFGSTDNNLLNYVAETANQYILFSLAAADSKTIPVEAAPVEAAPSALPAPG